MKTDEASLEYPDVRHPAFDCIAQWSHDMFLPSTDCSHDSFTVAVALLGATVPTSFAFDRPLQSSLIVLLSCAVTVLALSRSRRWDHHLESRHEDRPARSLKVPLQEVRVDFRSVLGLRLSSFSVHYVILVVAVCLRLETLRQVVSHVECASPTTLPLLCIIFGLLQYHGVRQGSGVSDNSIAAHGSTNPSPAASVRRAQRRLLAASLVGIGGLVVLGRASFPHSSHICAASRRQWWLIPALQWSSLVLDSTIIYLVHKLLHDAEAQGTSRPNSGLRSIGRALLASTCITAIAGLVRLLVTTNAAERARLLPLPTSYVWAVLKIALLLSVTLVSGLSVMHQIGVVSTLMLTISVGAVMTTIGQIYDSAMQYALPPSYLNLGLTIVVLVACIFHIQSTDANTNEETSGTRGSRRLPPKMYLLLYGLTLLLAVAHLSAWNSNDGSGSSHPVEQLISQARARHEAWKRQAFQSTTVNEAVQQYRERYNQHPPPGFQHWFRYAQSRDSIIIDDFDSIRDHLLPFYALSPSEIRERTWKIISNPWHDAPGISIRKGSLFISPLVKPTHRWMLEGVVAIIENFVEWLPDMDLAFNLNDECRVAVPFEKLQPMLAAGRSWQDITRQPRAEFSLDRSKQWKIVPDPPRKERVLAEQSWQRVFADWGAIGCPPNSAARIQRHWDVSKICLSCAAPHSLGPFLANWTLAGDVCHQPDLADLHGLYLSPAAFKSTHELYPIFSQSRAGGFNDILYPSAWNYQGKVKYNPSTSPPEPAKPNDENGDKKPAEKPAEYFPDPPYAEKHPSLFWRGSTTEGLSNKHQQWQGMSRQRFVHAVNRTQEPYSLRPAPYQPMFVPSDPDSPTSGYHISTHSHPSTSSSFSLAINSVTRCTGRECGDQEREFRPAEVDRLQFQGHWKYQLLLDLDGAGFSGRFLPFLKSRSLVLKAALFREWWDSRIDAWVHFVPLDLRAWGLTATVDFFLGHLSPDGAQRVGAHADLAEAIANDGREWATKVLRREDMEIYFFRLLLEWARLTDDARDELGYA